MKKVVNVFLAAAVMIPVVLLLWPFVTWSGAAAVILRVVPSFALQVLLCRVGKWNAIKALPVLVSGALAVWGTYLYATSPHWIHAAFWGSLVADYMSPFISCCVALLVCFLVRKKP